MTFPELQLKQDKGRLLKLCLIPGMYRYLMDIFGVTIRSYQ